MGYGALIAHLQDADEDGRDAALLVGSGAGLVAGRWLARSQSYSRGDAYLLTGCGVIGSLIGVTGAHLIGEDETHDEMRATIVGSLAGVAGNHYLTRKRDFSTGQSIVIMAGSVAGGLLGLGVAYLVSSDDMSDRARDNLYRTGGTLGLTGGLLAMHRALFDRAAPPPPKAPK
jgi:hypothetical protein